MRHAFRLQENALDPAALRAEMARGPVGALVVFEGWVRNEHKGRAVEALTYEAYPSMAVAEGEKILAEVAAAHGTHEILVVHRTGHLVVGEAAVWVGVTAGHRGPAFAATQAIMDELKLRVPIWKKEHFADGDSEWVRGAG